MAVFFKIAYDGKSIEVAKTFISNKIDSLEFSKKAKKISVEEFLQNVPERVKSTIESKINRIKEIQSMKLGMLGATVVSGFYSNAKEIYFHVGDNVFIDYLFGQENKKAEAIKYGIKYFGKEFMDENIELLNVENIRYYSGTKEISKEKFYDLNKELNSLNAIMNMNDIKKEIEIKKIRR